MKLASDLEIRVAIIGNVSVGKTTVLNALLKDKFSEVSMKRTTAGINLFRISTKQQENIDKKGSGGANHGGDVRSANYTLEQITQDNSVLRQSTELQEQTFEIALDEPLVEMRNDTKLVLIDVPGINEAGTSHKYKDYLIKNWHSFHCVVVVVDGLQGVNTEEQVQVLEFAKVQRQVSKWLPLIILLNKIDDPIIQEEQQVLVNETTQAIEQLFDTPDRVGSLSQIVGHTVRPVYESMARNVPVVIPLSAKKAYIFRVASNLTLDEFKTKIEESLVNKLGPDYYGRQWRSFGKEERYEKAYEMIRDRKEYKEGIKENRFDHFLSALSYCVGGTSTQEWLIVNQLRTSAKRLDSKMDYVQALGTMHDMSQAAITIHTFWIHGAAK